MKYPALALTALLTLSACTTGGSYSLEPIPGSITYGGQPRTKLTKSPIGSQVPHDFYDNFGQRVHETYIIEPDRSLRLVERHVEDEDFFGRD